MLVWVCGDVIPQMTICNFFEGGVFFIEHSLRIFMNYLTIRSQLLASVQGVEGRMQEIHLKWFMQLWN